MSKHISKPQKLCFLCPRTCYSLTGRSSLTEISSGCYTSCLHLQVLAHKVQQPAPPVQSNLLLAVKTRIRFLSTPGSGQGGQGSSSSVTATAADALQLQDCTLLCPPPLPFLPPTHLTQHNISSTLCFATERKVSHANY